MSFIAIFTIGRATKEGDFSSTVENDSVVRKTLRYLSEVGFFCIFLFSLNNPKSHWTSAVYSTKDKHETHEWLEDRRSWGGGGDSYFGTSLVLCSEAPNSIPAIAAHKNDSSSITSRKKII